MTVVYVDVLLLINFMVNFVLLRGCALLSGRTFSSGRAVLAAICGAVSALSIFAAYHGAWLSALLKLVFCAAMARMAFPFIGWRAWVKDVFCLFSVSFLFSGAMLAIFLTLGPRGMTVRNGAVYFDIHAPLLILVTALCYAVTSLLSALMRRRSPEAELCEVIITNEGGTRVLPALLDTGNHLCEPFSGLPAMVCGAVDLGSVLPMQLSELTLNAAMSCKLGFRMIPYDSIGGSGALPAFVPQALRIRVNGREMAAREGSYVAVSPGHVGGGQYCAIVNPAMLLNNSKVGETG